jgi:hypothetical protein
VTGTYLDVGLVKSTLGTDFCVNHNNCVLQNQGGFGVPEFNQSILFLVGVMLPALLLVRLRMPGKKPT